MTFTGLTFTNWIICEFAINNYFGIFFSFLSFADDSEKKADDTHRLEKTVKKTKIKQNSLVIH